jgi:hypothetical protein
MTNYFLVEGDVSLILVTDFMNLKIKVIQSFRDVHKVRVHVCIYRCECLSVYLYYVLKIQIEMLEGSTKSFQL